MKKLTSIIAFLLFGAATLSAQNAFVGGNTAWTIALQGGPMYSINENGFSYRDHGKGINLFTFQGSAAVGYEFTSVADSIPTPLEVSTLSLTVHST